MHKFPQNKFFKTKYRWLRNKVTKMCRATKRTYHNDNIARSIDKPAKIWESMKEIIFDNCPVKKTNLALNVNEEVVTERI
jgi:hypothetical protein